MAGEGNRRDEGDAHPSSGAPHVVYRFGAYELDPVRRRLVFESRPVRIASRAMEILKVLLEADGELVDKETLIAAVWPKTFVEEAALRVHISALRKVLGAEGGERYVVNAPGQGYRMGVPIRRERRGDDVEGASPADPYGLPAQLTRPIGREDVVRALGGEVRSRRLITVVGPGGVGKTTVALACAHVALPTFPDGVCYVDLAAISDPDRVAGALATALGLQVPPGEVTPSLQAQLQGKAILLVFDCCEHVIAAAARLAQELLQANPRLRILATSREPLRVSGEEVWRLPPLSVPGAGIASAQEAMTFAAVQLFVQRAAAAATEDFELTDDHAAAVADICRHLDGLPLAIEIAAGHFDVLGVERLRALLSERLPLDLPGSRTALARHRTLEATVDWSFELLSEAERRTLRRLSIFAGGFTLEGAEALLGIDDADGAWGVIEHLSALSAKSLITADISGPTPHYRMLDVTRAYARRRLDDAGETQAYARRHCEWMARFLRGVTREWDEGVTVEQLNVYARQIENLRAAVAWASSPDGDLNSFIRLAISGGPVWMHLGLVEEWREVVEEAVNLVPSVEPLGDDDLTALYLAQATTRHLVWGPCPETRQTWDAALIRARRLGEPRFILRALWAQWDEAYTGGRPKAALEIAEEYRRLAESVGSLNDVDQGLDMTACVYRSLGDPAAALRHNLPLRRRQPASPDLVQASRSLFDQQVAALSTLGDVLWVSGRPDQAREVCDEAVEHAQRLNHMPSLAYTLVFSATQVAVLCGDTARMAGFHDALEEIAHVHEPFTDWVRGIQSLVHVRRGEAARGVALLKETLSHRDRAWFHRVYAYFLTALGEGLCQVGDYAEGLARIEDSIEAAFREEDFWCLPDTYRIKGDLLLGASGLANADAAEAAYRAGLDCAVSQGALSWELRSANALAALRLRQGNPGSAGRILRQTYDRFEEGFDTADLRQAQALLARCETPGLGVVDLGTAAPY
ncbi:MAG: winged helix-turn-helix domain-containing protein [Pseudomonadota bacterium]